MRFRAMPLLLLAVPMVAPAMESARLRCEYLVNPLGVSHARPRLSWIDESRTAGDRQSAYRIVVGSTREGAAAGRGDLWDSGRVASDASTQIEYAGRRLKTGERAYWTVQLWDAKGAAGPVSAPAFWEMGMLSPSDWTANWISLTPPAPNSFEVKGASWIWYPQANPQADAPSGAVHFRYHFDLPGKKVASARIAFAVDDRFSARLNGKTLGTGDGWKNFTTFDITKGLRVGRNALEFDGVNNAGRAGALVIGEIKFADGTRQTLASGETWEASIDPTKWASAQVVARSGEGPYGRTRWADVPRPAPHVRRDFALHGTVARARLYVTARGLYRVMIDGKELENGLLQPGWTDYRKRIQYETIDVTDALAKGTDHAIGMVIGDGWYCGHIGLTGGNNYGDRPYGLAQLEIEYTDHRRERIVTDGSWKGRTGPILAADLLMGETYDARKELGDWTKPGYSGTGWGAVDTSALGKVPLVAQMDPPVRQIMRIVPPRVRRVAKGTYVYDLAQNMVGWVRLRLSGRAGQTVKIRYAEMLNPDRTIYTTNLRGAKATDFYTFKGTGVEEWEPSFTFHGFRYVEVSGLEKAPAKDAVLGVVVASATPRTSHFVTDNKLVNQLYRNIVWGQRGNYLSVPTDCPQRDERLGWMGDAQIFVRTATYNNDIASFMAKWTQDVVDAQSKEGFFADVSPRMGDQSDGAPAWSDAGVIVPWTIYRAYGDKRLLAERFDAMKKYVDLIDGANPDHLWIKRRNNDFGDWLSIAADTPREVLGTAYFARSTDLVARSARVLGRRAEAEHYEQLLAGIKRAFQDNFVADDGTIKGDTQTCYVLALWFDLLPEEKRAAAAARLTSDILERKNGHLSTGFVGVGYLNPTLTSVGRSDVAYRLLLNDTFPSWGYSIRQGATTIWERWDGWTRDKGFQDPGMNSFNHYSLGSVGEWMMASVAGIDLDPNVPGFKRFVVRPQVAGPIRRVNASFDSPHGMISNAWRVDANGVLTMDLTVPTNTQAQVILPGRAPITVGGGHHHFVAKVAAG